MALRLQSLCHIPELANLMVFTCLGNIVFVAAGPDFLYIPNRQYGEKAIEEPVRTKI